MAAPVPDWLRGTWKRSYIRRASSPSGTLGEPDSTVDVRYVQTPYAFVDVRRPPVPGGKEGPMAFAGVTSVVVDGKGGGNPPLVRWHACLEMDPPKPDPVKRWSEADAGSPRRTEDEGYFEDVSSGKGEDTGTVYRERDPGGTLEEEWVKIDDGGGRFLAARRGTALLVVAGGYFGYADHGPSPVFVSGRVTPDEGWRIELSAADATLEGTELRLPGPIEEWEVLPFSTVLLEAMPPLGS